MRSVSVQRNCYFDELYCLIFFKARAGILFDDVRLKTYISLALLTRIRWGLPLGFSFGFWMAVSLPQYRSILRVSPSMSMIFPTFGVTPFPALVKATIKPMQGAGSFFSLGLCNCFDVVFLPVYTVGQLVSFSNSKDSGDIWSVLVGAFSSLYFSRPSKNHTGNDAISAIVCSLCVKNFVHHWYCS